MSETFRYAYCFSHGRMHFFRAAEEPWCTATWVWLDALTDEAAEAEKTKRYGDAQFIDQLPLDQHVAVIEQAPLIAVNGHTVTDALLNTAEGGQR